MHLLPNALIRRRKSVEAKRPPLSPRTRVSRSPHSLLYGADIAPFIVAMSTSSVVAPTSPKSPISPKSSPRPWAHTTQFPGLSLEDTSHVSPPSTDSKFSTADRTILDELRRNIKARAEQFAIKGGNGIRWGEKGAGKRHHPFSKDEAPYPRSYERDVLDLCAHFF